MVRGLAATIGFLELLAGAGFSITSSLSCAPIFVIRWFAASSKAAVGLAGFRNSGSTGFQGLASGLEKKRGSWSNAVKAC